MKILFIKKLFSPVGGSETLAYQWAHRLASLGHEVRVLSLWPHSRRYDYPPAGQAMLTGRHFRRFEDGGVAVYHLAPRLGALGKMFDMLPFSSLVRNDLALSLADGCDLVHNICREYVGTARAIARRWQIPLVLTPLPHPGQLFGGASSADAALYSKADGIVAMTKYEKSWYESLGISSEKVAVVGSGAVVNSGGDGLAFRSRHHISGSIVLFVGRQEPYKGYLAIKAAAKLVWQAHPDTHFVFIGEKGFWARLVEPWFDGRDQRMLNLEVVDESEKADAYAACDLFCMPSAHETLGLAYLEAWSYGKPVIGGDIAPLRVVIHHGVDGLLVRQVPAEIAAAVNYLLHDRAVACRMGSAGLRRLQKDFNWQVVMANLADFYQRILGFARDGRKEWRLTTSGH